MGSKKTMFVVLLAAIVGLSGCYNTPVRHLASDVALLKVGTSTKEDVLVFLGEPDEQQAVDTGTERWLYLKEDRALFEKTPFVGKHIGSPEYSRVVVTLTNGIVTECVFSSTDEDDFDWADDFSWQEKKK
jgi:outer membrane protein assembly factor BamE (lipoprotein component of BamABCDE complex)